MVTEYDKSEYDKKGCRMKQKMRKSVSTIGRIMAITLACVIFFSISLLPKATSCIGRLLYLGITDAQDQKIMAEVLCTMIGESTGTKVNVVKFKTLDECREEIRKGQLDLYVDYVCSGLISVLNVNGEKGQQPGPVTIENAAKAYSTVKHLSDKRFSLIWLKPFGYDNPSILTAPPAWLNGIPNSAVCVARRETLNRFPVLPRLINKLGDKIPNGAIEDLAKNKDLKVAVKAFLEERKLIRWAIQ
jgi:osmoprotectant transport system substrate-binding protein